MARWEAVTQPKAASLRSSYLDVGEFVRASLDELTRRTGTTLELCDLAERRLLEQAGELIQARLRLRAELEGERFRRTPQGFYFGSELYQVRLRENAVQPSVLQVAICRVINETPLDKAVALRVPVHSNGRYASIRLILDDSLARHQDRLAVDLQTLFREGYRWLEAQVRGDLFQLAEGLAASLYIDLRAVLEESLTDLVGLYLIDQQGAYYVLDARAAEGALENAAARRAASRESALELATMLATQLLPPGETVSQAALDEGRPLDVPLELSRYLDSGLQVAEQVFFDTMSLIAQPLVQDGAVRVAACYPAEARDQIAPSLDIAARRMPETIRSRRRVIRRRRNNARFGSTRVDRAAEVAGIFGGSFAGSYAETLK